MANIKWSLDPMHSEILFKVKHLMISTVTGYFKKFDVQVESASDDFNSVSSVKFTADLDSIDTNNEQRDVHLKSADFFDAGAHSQLLFTGTSFDLKGGEGTLNGDLTIKGVTKPVKLNVEHGGIVKDPYGQTKAGFTVTGKISRKDFGLTWSAVTEAGNVVVGDEIRVEAEIQLVKQA